MSVRSLPLALALGAAFALPALVLPSLVHAQNEVYGSEDLSAMPKLVSQAATARLIARSTPEDVRRSNGGGTVQIQFTIDKSGHVEPNSIEVVSTTIPTLATAARTVVEKMEFVPGKKDGAAVRARVQLPIIYKP